MFQDLRVLLSILGEHEYERGALDVVHKFFPYMETWVKMAKYPNFQKFVAKKHCFGTKWESTTFYVLKLTKLEFLVSFHSGTTDLKFVQ